MTVKTATITGSGFTIVGGSLPATLNPTQTVTLQVQFLPTAVGPASGQISISSDSSTGSTAVVAPERYEHGSTKSSVDGERCKSEFRKRNSEQPNDTVLDVDVDWDVTSDSELSDNYGVLTLRSWGGVCLRR